MVEGKCSALYIKQRVISPRQFWSDLTITPSSLSLMTSLNDHHGPAQLSRSVFSYQWKHLCVGVQGPQSFWCEYNHTHSIRVERFRAQSIFIWYIFIILFYLISFSSSMCVQMDFFMLCKADCIASVKGAAQINLPWLVIDDVFLLFSSFFLSYHSVFQV